MKENFFCADVYGDAIYLARMMANSFDDVNYEQYDDCISAPDVPEIRAIEDIMADIKILPNPTNGIVNLLFPKSIEGNCQVLDITGKIIMTQSFNDVANLELNLTGYTGFHLIRITSNKVMSKVFKIFVVK